MAITIYGPNGDDPDFYQKHVFNINNFPAQDFTMWAGDWNLVLDQTKYTKNYKGEHNKKARSCVIANIASNNLVNVWRASHPHKCEYTWRKTVRKTNPTAQRARLDFILTCEELASHIKGTGNEIRDKISDHSGTWIEFDTVGIKRGPDMWRFNSSFLQEPDFIKIVNDVMKLHTRIHAKHEMTDSQWGELQIEDYSRQRQ